MQARCGLMWLRSVMQMSGGQPLCTPSSSSRNGPGKSLYPLDDYVIDLNFSPSHQAFLVAVSAGIEPKRYSDAIKEKV